MKTNRCCIFLRSVTARNCICIMPKLKSVILELINLLSAWLYNSQIHFRTAGFISIYIYIYSNKNCTCKIYQNLLWFSSVCRNKPKKWIRDVKLLTFRSSHRRASLNDPYMWLEKYVKTAPISLFVCAQCLNIYM